MTLTHLILAGLILTVGSSAMLIVLLLIERRRDRREKRLACLQDPVNCRCILKR